MKTVLKMLRASAVVVALLSLVTFAMASNLPKEFEEVSKIAQSGEIVEGVWVKERISDDESATMICVYDPKTGDTYTGIMEGNSILFVGYLSTPGYLAEQYKNGVMINQKKLTEEEVSRAIQRFLVIWNNGGKVPVLYKYKKKEVIV